MTFESKGVFTSQHGSGLRVLLGDNTEREFINTNNCFFWTRLVKEKERPFAEVSSEYPGDLIIYQQDSKTNSFSMIDSIPGWSVEEVQVIELNSENIF